MTGGCEGGEAGWFVGVGGWGMAAWRGVAIREGLAWGGWGTVMEERTRGNATMWALWPASRHPSPKLRVFVDHLARHMFA
ncbi:hypothetical protein [Achromobacter ruhlandii]|uniref:hypothetical protein n=1 Tax=Achromobacter ruhlandii TaxID=72557 RepID=UPI0020163C51|nr:hypothetical protein [Achromobacter ruhlandii]